jgi:superfamily II RNA helicase
MTPPKDQPASSQESNLSEEEDTATSTSSEDDYEDDGVAAPPGEAADPTGFGGAPVTYRGLVLDGFQAEAIAALERGESVLVSAPTGTGKTVVADWLVERTLERGREVVFTAPIKALSNQKFRDYCRLLGEEKVGLVTGDLVIRRDAPCKVMTTEILRNMLLAGDQVADLGCVIVDEIHFLDDRERGTTWEEVLIYLPQHVQIVGLSATLSNLREFAGWLAQVRSRPVTVVEERRRAVPLDFAVATKEGGLCSPKEMREVWQRWARKTGGSRRPKGHHRDVSQEKHPTRHSDVFRMLWPDMAPWLYFVFSRRDAESMARSLVRTLDHSLLEYDEEQAVRNRIRQFTNDPSASSAFDDNLFEMLRQGVAFHHAGLHVALKALVEELYENRLVKVLYCTGTFALGINMPARTAVFDGLERFDGRGMIPLPSREFMQMAGRAGRRGMDARGLVVIRTDVGDWPEIEMRLKAYMEGRSEPVRSRFGLSFNSVVNLLERHSSEQIRHLVERSFLAWHRSARARTDGARADELAAELRAAGWEEGSKAPAGQKGRYKEWRMLRARADAAPDQTWEEFQGRVRFLQSFGYLDAKGEFNAGAKALRAIQFSEIFVVECFLAGIFDEVDEDTLYGIATAMCVELPRAARVKPDPRLRKISSIIDKVRGSEIVLQAEELTGIRASWDAQLVPFGRAWAQGRSLAELLEKVDSTTDISGDLVGAFRRARDLVGQIADLYSHDPERAEALHKLCQRVRRDEVEVID